MGQGYHTEPVWVEFSEGETVADIVTRVLGEGNYTATGEGTSFYLASLKEELVKLINDDYEAFISLSTDLKDEGTRLTKVRQPLGSLKDHIIV